MRIKTGWWHSGALLKSYAQHIETLRLQSNVGHYVFIKFTNLQAPATGRRHYPPFTTHTSIPPSTPCILSRRLWSSSTVVAAATNASIKMNYLILNLVIFNHIISQIIQWPFSCTVHTYIDKHKCIHTHKYIYTYILYTFRYTYMIWYRIRKYISYLSPYVCYIRISKKYIFAFIYMYT